MAEPASGKTGRRATAQRPWRLSPAPTALALAIAHAGALTAALTATGRLARLVAAPVTIAALGARALALHLTLTAIVVLAHTLAHWPIRRPLPGAADAQPLAIFRAHVARACLHLFLEPGAVGLAHVTHLAALLHQFLVAVLREVLLRPDAARRQHIDAEGHGRGSDREGFHLHDKSSLIALMVIKLPETVQSRLLVRYTGHPVFPGDFRNAALCYRMFPRLHERQPMNESKTHILVVDDDAALRELLGRYLTEQGFRVDAVADGTAMDRQLAVARPDLVILDLMLPGEDGLALARRLRAQGDLPIVMLSARGEDVDRIVGLEGGAGDYLAKPFNPRELLARIRAVLRRHGAAPADTPGVNDTRAFGPFRLDTAMHRLLRDGAEVPGTGAEFTLLR